MDMQARISAQMVQLRDLLAAHQDIDSLLKAFRAHLYIEIGGYCPAYNFGRIDNDAVFLNDAAFLQSLDARLHSNARQPDLFREIDIGNTRVVCQNLDDFPVDIIQTAQIHMLFPPPFRYCYYTEFIL